MSRMRQAQQIEVGIYEGRVGFTIHYTDGERAHFLFRKDFAKQFAERLLKIIAELDYVDRQLADLDYVDQQLTGTPADRIAVQESIRVQLTPPPPPETGQSLGIGVNEGPTVND